MLPGQLTSPVWTLRLLLLVPFLDAAAQPSIAEDDVLALVQRSTTASDSQAEPLTSLLELGPQEVKPRLWEPHAWEPHPSSSGFLSKMKASIEAASGSGSCSSSEREQIVRSLRAISEGRGVADSVCHTAVHGEQCYRDTEWAMTDSFNTDPKLYVGLKKTSSFEEFQMYLYKIGHASCPKPCMPGGGAAFSAGPAVSLRRSERSVSTAQAGASAEAVFGSMPLSCTTNMTHNYGINFEQMEKCFQSLLRFSKACSSCASEFLQDFVGKDIFNMRGVCLSRCRPMSAACQLGTNLGTTDDSMPSDCLEKAAMCMECVQPSVEKFLTCAGFPNKEQLHDATAMLVQDFRNHTILYPGKLDAVARLVQEGSF